MYYISGGYTTGRRISFIQKDHRIHLSKLIRKSDHVYGSIFTSGYVSVCLIRKAERNLIQGIA